MMIALCLFVATVHLYFIWALGAAFGLDSIIYAQLGQALLTEGGLQQFYSGPRYYIYQHLAPGLPLLWTAASLAAGTYGWLLFTVVQHIVAGASVLYLLSILRPLLSGPFMALAAVLVTCDPMYQSLHNRPMTESVSGSMFVLGLAATISMLLHRSVRPIPLFVLTASGVAAIFFRSHAVVYFLIFFGAVTLSHGERTTRAPVLVCLLIVVASFFAWPAYRLALTGHTFLPNTSYLALAHALRYNANPSDMVIVQLKAFPLPPDLPAERLATYGVTYPDSAVIGKHLRGRGLDDVAAKSEIKKIAWSVRTDSAQVILNQLRIPLLSVGVTYPVFLGDPDMVIHRGYTAREYDQHVVYWKKWDGGTLWDDYTPEFDGMLKTFRSSPDLYDPAVVEKLDQSLRPFLAHHPVSLRDPLHLLKIPSDIWIVGWVVALLGLWKTNRWIVGVLMFPVLASYVISVSVPIGNPRYGYPLIPMYMIGFVIGLALVTTSVLRSKSYPASAAN